jgi:DNA-directed RNA polymerase specialized sigma24 family protein
VGSADPEAAAREALKLSLEDPGSHSAIEYYFGLQVRGAEQPADWPLDRLFEWLNGVLRHVVQQERGHGRAQPIDQLIAKERQRILKDCFPKLRRDQRAALKLRADGMKDGEIAGRLGVQENAAANLVSDGIRDLAQCIRRRTKRLI